MSAREIADEHGNIISQEPEGDEYLYENEEKDWPKCPCCNGKGTVTPLTVNVPKDFFCVGVTDCPVCDGTGECP